MTDTASGRPTWEDRLAAVKGAYPSTADRYWVEAVQDYALMGGLIHELLRVGHTPKRRGSRPGLEQDAETMARLRELWGDDYSTLPFAETFTMLKGTRSRSQLVTLIRAKTGVYVSRTQIHRFLTGQAAPGGRDMEVIARAFNKKPTYFHEYRLGLVIASVVALLDASPEQTASLVQQLGVDQE